MYRTGTFTGTTSGANENIMTAIKATAGLDSSKPMVFKTFHFESTADTTIIINNGIAMKLKPSPLVSGSYFIDLDKSVALVGFCEVVDNGITWEVTGAY